MLAICTAFEDISIPIPFEFFNSLNMLNNIHPVPVPMSKINISFF